MSDAIESMKAKAYYSLKEELKYDSKRVLREEKIGNWIVTIEPLGYTRTCYIYNADTLLQHYKYYIDVLTCNENAPKDVKAFYQRAEDRVFKSVCDLAKKWN